MEGQQEKKQIEQREAIALKGKSSGLIIQKSGDGIRISIYNTKGKTEKKIEDLELDKEQWIAISNSVLKNCF